MSVARATRGAAGGALERALDFQRATLKLVAERIEPIDQGWVVSAPSLPRVWSTNHVRITQPVTFSDALELAETHLGNLPYRQLMIEHEPTGRRLEKRFAEEGWRVEREVVMQLLGKLEPAVGDVEVVEAGEERVMGLMRRWVGEDESLELTPGGLDQVVEFARRVVRARSAQMLGVAGERGGLASIATLFSDGEVAQVEDVYTVPEERNRGYARALVTRAGRLARKSEHEIVFIVADDKDWPKQLYARIGFMPIGWTWAVHRDG